MNPYPNRLPDDVVEDYYQKYKKSFDQASAELGLPDKFTYECLREYMWRNDHVILPVSTISTYVSSVFVHSQGIDGNIVRGIVQVG